MVKSMPKAKKLTKRVIVPNIDTAWFERELNAAGVTHREMAGRFDPPRHESAIGYLIRGQRRMALTEAGVFAAAFGTTVEEVMRRAGAPPLLVASGEVPIIGWVDGQLTVHLSPPRGPRSAPRPSPAPAALVALRFQTSGSKLAGFDGALAYYVRSKAVSPECLLKPCVVETSETSTPILRVVHRGYESGRFRLENLAGETWEEDVKLVSAAPILVIRLG